MNTRAYNPRRLFGKKRHAGAPLQAKSCVEQSINCFSRCCRLLREKCLFHRQLLTAGGFGPPAYSFLVLYWPCVPLARSFPLSRISLQIPSSSYQQSSSILALSFHRAPSQVESFQPGFFLPSLSIPFSLSLFASTSTSSILQGRRACAHIILRRKREGGCKRHMSNRMENQSDRA